MQKLIEQDIAATCEELTKQLNWGHYNVARVITKRLLALYTERDKYR